MTCSAELIIESRYASEYKETETPNTVRSCEAVIMLGISVLSCTAGLDTGAHLGHD